MGGRTQTAPLVSKSDYFIEIRALAAARSNRSANAPDWRRYLHGQLRLAIPGTSGARFKASPHLWSDRTVTLTTDDSAGDVCGQAGGDRFWSGIASPGPGGY